VKVAECGDDIPPWLSDLRRIRISLAEEKNSLFWYMGMLIFRPAMELADFREIEELKSKINQLDRSHPNVVWLIMFPDRDGMGKKDFEKALAYLLREFIPRNPGSKFITPEDLLDLVESEEGKEIKKETLKTISENIIKTCGSGDLGVLRRRQLPEYMTLNGEFFSCADIFEAFTRALSRYNEEGKLPQVVNTREILGPIGDVEEVVHVPRTILSSTDIVKAASRVEAVINNSTPIRAPMKIDVGGYMMNPSEFLLVMAKVYHRLSNLDKAFSVEALPTRIVPRYAAIMDIVFENAQVYDYPLWYSKLQLWTIKPALWKKQV
jgi:hypothetical protein